MPNMLLLLLMPAYACSTCSLFHLAVIMSVMSHMQMHDISYFISLLRNHAVFFVLLAQRSSESLS